MRMMLNRQWPVGVIQICWIAPGPSMLAITRSSPGSMGVHGETFHPWPRSRAQDFGSVGIAIPPAPFLPSTFSELIDRVFAEESRDKFPRFIPNPLNAMEVSVKEWSNPAQTI